MHGFGTSARRLMAMIPFICACTTIALPEAAARTGNDEATAIAWPVVPDPNVDPIIAAALVRMSDKGAFRKYHDDDVAAMKAFYTGRQEGALWAGPSGFTPAAVAVRDEIKNADDWGLRASDFELPNLRQGAGPEVLGAAETQFGLAVLGYARHARGGRIDPSSVSRIVDMDPQLKDPAVVLTEIAASSAPDAYLRGLHPKHEQFRRLRKALLQARGGGSSKKDRAQGVALPDGPALKRGDQHQDVVILRKRLKVPADVGASPNYLDAALARAIATYQKEAGLRVNGRLDSATRDHLNGDAEPERRAKGGRKVQLILNNMERWRWMPADLGPIYVWNNVPEYRVRVYKNNKEVFSEKIIVGLPEWATPTFAADMKYIIFHPSWGVPNGIKMKELLPRLRRASPQTLFDFFGGGGGGGASVLRAYNLTAYRNGSPVDPDSVNWANTDIRNYSFIQPPGGKNPLGIVKFRFPNKHDVYMHDTIEKELFGRPTRAYSHGCIRVQDPMRLAEVLLEEDKGWSRQMVRQALHGGADVELNKKIPVYVSYMTAVIDDDGNMETFGDIYGRDSRLAARLGQAMQFDRPEIDVLPPREERVADKKKRRKNKTTSASNNYQFPRTISDSFSGLRSN